MLTRIVKMHFDAEFVPTFITLFKNLKPQIMAFDGCQQVNLLQDKTDKNTFFTISIWQSEAHLENYRNAAFFKQTWAKVKPNFTSKAEAWSLVNTKTI